LWVLSRSPDQISFLISQGFCGYGGNEKQTDHSYTKKIAIAACAGGQRTSVLERWLAGVPSDRSFASRSRICSISCARKETNMVDQIGYVYSGLILLRDLLTTKEEKR
jgi:hypothetical protein